MHLQSCLHPLRIYNKYLHEFQYVPCGKCAACRNRHASYWTERLRTENKCWRYIVFVTLTYDMDKRPCFTTKDNRIFVGSPKCFNPEQETPIIDFDELCLKCGVDSVMRDKNERWLQQVAQFGRVPHLSRYHCQLFIKRLRKNLKNIIKKKYEEKCVREDYLVRYFLAGEYGETTLAPHYHGVFWFNSEKEAAYFKEAINKSWTLGNTDVSFVHSDASAYVAAYVNSFGNLPILLQVPSVRPFALCSKNVPIGTLLYNDTKIKELFDSASPTFVLPKRDGTSYIDVPLWRTFKDRLFPRLPFFDLFDTRDLCSLYGSVCRFDDWSGKEATVNSFVGYIWYCHKHSVVNRFYNLSLKKYMYVLLENGYDSKMIENNLIHLYYISKRCYYQCVIWSMSLYDYVSTIERFYSNCERENLKVYFKFQEDFSLKYDNDSLLSLDLDYLVMLFQIDRCDLSYEDIVRLTSYGVDLDRFYSPDLSVSMPYRLRFVPENCLEFVNYFADQTIIANNRVKTKRKNDYLRKLAAQDTPYRDLILAIASFYN